MQNRSRFIRNGVIAAIVGSTCGALAGVWSVHRLPTVRTPVAQVPATTAVVASSSTPPRAKAINEVPVRRDEYPAATAAVPVSSPPARAIDAPAAAVPPRPLNAPAAASHAATAADPLDVLERARALAQRPDVKALVALREGVARRAAERGEKDSAVTKQQIDELDRYLAEARALRLKIDALEFRK